MMIICRLTFMRVMKVSVLLFISMVALWKVVFLDRRCV